MSITDWPAKERPREKLLSHGASVLSDAELLALFVRTGVRGKTALDISRELLMQFGGLRYIVAASLEQFTKSLGLGLAKYVQIQAAKELATRCLQENLEQRNTFENPQDVYEYLTHKLQSYPYEVFSCLFLDNAHRFIHFKELFHGSINEAAVYPRELIRQVYQHNAAAVILAHNHPSGIAKPSEADKRITQEIKTILTAIDVRLLDHIIIGEGRMTSFASQGLL
ncbi:DNA repair protein RadC [Rickettsiella endosymbiont of Litargus connexus]|jgi:DNA repair protein RadC|uniref:RadC family protein n=1 Tax=Rickettsiella endosymbiont of Litargus connexus TaxID=3066237 RepID=UPI0027E6CDD3|nr:DNA repair protein RadC [Gammaproteobacteria bacterium]MCH9755464.1 DNA repair protein RadC [Gammaproteobacteria bacterium]MDD4892578.1 DNA repair protein RadC [Candidatus Rickettsiella isopodorum]MDD5161950.1 DNA repair protein RadC [Candidatus Rickettsiella isopodorum]MDQ5900397.1 repair protein RadC [Pseudomonadota bacterium]